PQEARMKVQQHFSGRLAVKLPSVSSTKMRNARLPFPPSQLLDVYGTGFAFYLAQDAYGALRRDPANRHYVRLPDLQPSLREELVAAYKFLPDEHNQDVWHFCARGRAALARTRQFAELENRRDRFRSQIADRILVPAGLEQKPHPIAHSTTAALA